MDITNILGYIESITNKWFLSSASCLRFQQSNKYFLEEKSLYIGVYCSENEAKDIVDSLPTPDIKYLDNLIVEASFSLQWNVFIFFFKDFHGYVVETRYIEPINRYRLLCYDPSIILGGTSLIRDSKVRMLNKSHEYCSEMFGHLYQISDDEWNIWNDPKNILWEDFIIKPIKLE